MSYVHYYHGHVALNNKTVRQIDVIIRTANARIAGRRGYGNPIITPYSGVVLNGSAHAEGTAEALEIVHGENHTGTIDTNNQAYGVVVTAILMLLADRNNDFQVCSYNRDSIEWGAARKLYHTALPSALPASSHAPVSDHTVHHHATPSLMTPVLTGSTELVTL